MDKGNLHYAPPYEHTVRQIDEIYRELDVKTEEFKRASGLRCPGGCGRCCMSENIEATPLEFLPLAAHLWETGEAEKWAENIRLLKERRSCVLFRPDPYKPGDGRCMHYSMRGLICRAFGYTASKDKYSVTRFIGCKVMREDFPENFENTREAVSKGLYIPLVTVFSYRLISIDQTLGRMYMPINKAIGGAIERVGFIRGMCQM
jgi:uncharacterized protein